MTKGDKMPVSLRGERGAAIPRSASITLKEICPLSINLS